MLHNQHVLFVELMEKQKHKLHAWLFAAHEK